VNTPIFKENLAENTISGSPHINPLRLHGKKLTIEAKPNSTNTQPEIVKKS